MASKSKYVRKNHYVETIEEGYRILMDMYGSFQKEKPFLIVTDDDVQSYLDLRYDELKERFLFFMPGRQDV